MPRRKADLDVVQTFVSWGSIAGLALLLIPWVAAMAGVAGEPARDVVRSTLFLVAITLPFALGFLSRWVLKDLRKRRWLWLVCFAGVPVPSFFLHGLGVYLTVVALVYLWAFFATRSTSGEAVV